MFHQFYQVSLNRFSFDCPNPIHPCQEESRQMCLALQLLEEIIGNNQRENPFLTQQSPGGCHQLPIAKRQRMTRLCTLVVGANQGIIEKRRITHDGIELFRRFKRVHIRLKHLNSVCKRRSIHIIYGLQNRHFIDVNSRYPCFRIPLRHHHGYQPSSRANI